jgi:hypothetical protein
MLRQAKNRVRVEGVLSEINLKYGSFVNKNTGNTVENIGGHIKVLVHQIINGQDTTLDIPVYMFASKYTNAGKLNPAYESIETVMNSYVSIAAAGGEAGADKIRITNGDIRMNEYYNQQGQLVSFPRVNASFINKAINDFRPEASFELEFAVSSLDYVTDNDGVELDPKKLRIKAIVPQYGGKVDTIEMFATNPKVIDAITSYWENGKTYTAKGRLNFSVTTQEVVEEMDFGEPEVRVRTTTVSELIVTSGTQAPAEDDMAFDPVELSAALKDHKAYLETLKDRALTKQTPAPVNTTSSKAAIDLGF